mgnify:CR=1 FL=1
MSEKEKKDKKVLVDVRDLTVQFGSRKNPFTAVDKASFQIYKGETFGLVGESGSGKTTIGRAIIRINPTASGEIIYDGERISGKISKAKDKEVTRRIQMIFQDPMASLNERAKVDYIIAEGLLNLPKKLSKQERNRIISEALDSVGLLPEFASRFPHEFSGGQRQRIGIARAQVLNLMAKLQREMGLTYLFISHDLSVMRFICDRICVIHKGVLVELAETEELFAHPMHPYTQALLSAIPMPDPEREKKKVLKVYDPSQHDYSTDKPKWMEIRPDHFVWANEAEFAKYQEELNK